MSSLYSGGMERRREIPERRKRYGWLVFGTVAAWAGVGLMIFFVDPDNIKDLVLPGSYLLFTTILSVAVFLLLAIIFLSARRALWWTLGLLVFFYLRINGLGSLLNGMLIIGILVCGELYIRMDKMGYTLKHASVDPETK